VLFRSRNDRGFSLTELVFVVAMLGTLIAMAVPVMKDITASIKLNEAARMVEREMQAARLKAVSSNRVIRVRLNCPATGSIRSVEVLGSPDDTAADRCATTRFPFPAPDNDMMTRPNFDGPVRYLPNGASVTTSVIQFSPDGTAMSVVNGTPTTLVSPLTVTVMRQSASKSMTVNNAGKVQLQ
jgi:prepilin-type N-terminal cleavage/methylation domain-containing protein